MDSFSRSDPSPHHENTKAASHRYYPDPANRGACARFRLQKKQPRSHCSPATDHQEVKLLREMVFELKQQVQDLQQQCLLQAEMSLKALQPDVDDVQAQSTSPDPQTRLSGPPSPSLSQVSTSTSPAPPSAMSLATVVMKTQPAASEAPTRLLNEQSSARSCSASFTAKSLPRLRGMFK